jgi:hypothetical protein
LPTGATGGGGSLRGRSAAAAALSMAKDAAVTTDRIFSITIPLDSGTEEGRSPLPITTHRHLARTVSTAARFNDALTELATQRKSAYITYTVDPFRESVARIARTLPREVFERRYPEPRLTTVSGSLSVAIL